MFKKNKSSLFLISILAIVLFCGFAYSPVDLSIIYTQDQGNAGANAASLVGTNGYYFCKGQYDEYGKGIDLANSSTNNEDMINQMEIWQNQNEEYEMVFVGYDTAVLYFEGAVQADSDMIELASE